MKVGILTQPLLSNYGGILQNYALQKSLIKLGVEPITFDYFPLPTKSDWLLHSIKDSILIATNKKQRFDSYPKRPSRSLLFQSFILNNINLTDEFSCYSNLLISKNSIDAIIVGSDQVWRPKYNYHISDAYLSFVRSSNIKRIAYAVSFGVDFWEYNMIETISCSVLAKKFIGISVREKSGILLCSKHLNVNAIEVLDPTLLLDVKDYCALCDFVPVEKEQFLAAYILDINKDKEAFIKRISDSLDIRYKLFSVDDKSSLSVEQWISMFRDAKFIITDSFHGVAFCIIFRKPFYVFVNKKRGATRFDSLLKRFELKERAIDESKPKTDIVPYSLDWSKIDSIRGKWVEKSIAFLNESLWQK